MSKTHMARARRAATKKMRSTRRRWGWDEVKDDEAEDEGEVEEEKGARGGC